MTTARASGTIDVVWNDVPRADSYALQVWRNDRWTRLPADGVEVTFDGASAVVRGLAAGRVHYLRVRASNSHGVSEWSRPAPSLTPVWDAELTAGRDLAVFPVSEGHSIWGKLGGTLAPDRFVVAGAAYQVQFLTHSRGGMWLGLDRDLPQDFTLIVGDSVFRGSESLVTTAGAGRYWWPSASPEWLGDGAVGVVLNVDTDAALGNRRKAPVFGHFGGWPAEHDTSGDVTLHVYFSEPAADADALRDHILSVSGGAVSGVEPADRYGRIWAVSVTPEGWEPVTVAIAAGMDCGLPEAVCAPDGRQLFNPMELTVPAKLNHAPTGAPVIGGIPGLGETLTVDTSGVADADGMHNAEFAYQWIRSDGRRDADIDGATDASYTLTQADRGAAFKVRVTFTDDDGKPESLTSAVSRLGRPYGLAAAASDSSVELTWELPAVWSYNTGLYQILRSRPELGETEPQVHVEFAYTATTAYTDTDVEPGVLYEYRIKGVDPFGDTGEASDPVAIRTPPSEPPANSPATGAPAISGTMEVGGTLAADTSGISDADGMTAATFTYQWIADDADIAGATAPSYNATAADENKTLRVRVSFVDDEGNDETLTSAPTDAISPRPPQLTAEFLNTPTSHDGQNPFTFELRFSEHVSLSYVDLKDHAFTVTSGTVTGARRLDRPSNIRWEITVQPDADADVTILLAATENCDDQGAICAPDTRMLSDDVTITITGPLSGIGRTPGTIPKSTTPRE